MSQPTTPNPETSAQQHSAPSDAGVFAVIADLESRLASLKQMHEQGSRRQFELDGREAELAARDHELRQQIAGLASRQSEIESLAANLAERQQQFERSVATLDARQAELDRLAQQAAQARHEADRRSEAADTAERQMAEHARILDERRAAMEALAAEAQHAREEVNARASELAERESELQAKLDAAQKLFAEAQHERESAQAELASLEDSLAQREQAMAQTMERLEKERAELAEGQENLAEAQQRLAEESARCRREMAEREEEARERDASLRELEERLNERMAELKIEAEQVHRERVMVTEQARTLAEQSSASDEHASAIHSGRAEQVQIQLGEANARAAGLQAELAQVRADLAGALDELAQAQAAAGQAAGVVDPEELERRDRTIQQLNDEIEQLRGVTGSLQSRLEESENAAASMHGADEQEISRRELAITKLKEHLEESRGEIESLRQRAEQAERKAREARQASGAADPDLVEFITARRGRLARYKSLLQGQARKIIQAQAALQKRHSECEQVLAQRQKLQAAYDEVQKREKRAAGTSARTGAMALVCYSTVTLGVLAALSWTVAEKLWPSTYAAQATIEADSRGRATNENELRSWQTYHEDLVKNPQLMEVAAERMARRGLAKLGTPAELRAKLDADMFVQSAGAGKLTLELREVGQDRAKLVLDTYITALKSVADAARESRAEDLGTAISAPASVLAAPVVDKRLEHAGMLLAGGSLAAFLGGLLVWSRMSAAKQKFERAQAVDEALEQVDWAKLEASMARSGGPGTGTGGEAAKGRKASRAKV